MVFGLGGAAESETMLQVVITGGHAGKGRGMINVNLIPDLNEFDSDEV